MQHLRRAKTPVQISLDSKKQDLAETVLQDVQPSLLAACEDCSRYVSEVELATAQHQLLVEWQEAAKRICDLLEISLPAKPSEFSTKVIKLVNYLIK